MLRYMDLPGIRCFISAPKWTCFSCDALRSITMRPCIGTRGRIVTEPNATHGKRIRVGRGQFGSVQWSSAPRQVRCLAAFTSRSTILVASPDDIKLIKVLLTTIYIIHTLKYNETEAYLWRSSSSQLVAGMNGVLQQTTSTTFLLAHKFLTGLVQLLQAREIVLGKYHILYQQNIWSFVDDQTVISSCIKRQLIPDKFMSQSRSSSFIILNHVRITLLAHSE